MAKKRLSGDRRKSNVQVLTLTFFCTLLSEIQQQLAQVASSVICSGGVSAEEVIHLNTDAFHIQNTEVRLVVTC